MLHVLISIVLLSIIVESITYALLKAEVLDKPRDILKSSNIVVEKLLSCGYCLSFWVALFVLVVSNLTLIQTLILSLSLSAYVGFIFCWVLLHRLSNIVHGAIDKYFDRSRDLRYINVFTEE